MMYYDTCDMTILEILLFVDEMLCYYSDVIFWKIIYACFGLIENVASKFLVCLYYMRDLLLKGLGCYKVGYQTLWS